MMKDASKFYKLEGEKLIKTHRSCPKCGQSYFLADHYDRWSCGKCGYTVFKRRGKKPIVKGRTSRRTPRRRTKSN
ncbi:MAG: 30S ribosomal protein S27ae [Promethearchaeota archaeon]